ncbi:MAG: hypothetical protein ACOYYS_27210 [Chloroflexota bacterium]
MIFTPPSTYEQIPSALEGITVWRPRSQAKAAVAPQTYTCPQCGAATKYDVAAGGVACEYCGHTAQAAAQTVGRKAQESEFTVETWQQAAQGWGVERRELHCESCGANLAVAEGSLTATCPFCASNKVNVRAAASEALRPHFVIPFKIQAAQLRTAVKAWLGRGWFHPGELAASAAVGHFTGMYVSYWTFDARVSAHWKAEVGHEVSERYYDHGDKEWKTRTKIEWRWENGQIEQTVDDLLISGSSRLSQALIKRVEPFNLHELAAYSPDFLAGWQAQAYDITLPQAWSQGKNIVRQQAKEACYQDTHSNHVRNFSMSADFADETWRYILLPIYVATYRFGTKTFQVMVNGQTGNIAGQKPVAWWKVWLAMGALLAPGGLLGLIGLPLLAAAGVGLFVLIASAILLAAGGMLAYNIYQQAVASEAI